MKIVERVKLRWKNCTVLRVWQFQTIYKTSNEGTLESKEIVSSSARWKSTFSRFQCNALYNSCSSKLQAQFHMKQSAKSAGLEEDRFLSRMKP